MREKLSSKNSKTLGARQFPPLGGGAFSVNNAFTLAEVLITLGIIGVVAAMTMPSLITNYQEKALETQIAKSKTTLANGYKLMTAKNEDLKLANLPMMTECSNLTDVACMSKYHKESFSIVSDSPALDADVMPAEYSVQGSEDKSPFKWDDVDYMFMTGDGMVYGVIPGGSSSTLDIVADVNGAKKPNVAVKDLRKFRLSGDGGIIYDVSGELTEIEEEEEEDDVVAGCSSSDYDSCKSKSDCEAAGGEWCGNTSIPSYCLSPNSERACLNGF